MTPAPLTPHDFGRRVPADTEDRVIAVAWLPRGWEEMDFDELDAALARQDVMTIRRVRRDRLISVLRSEGAVQLREARDASTY